MVFLKILRLLSGCSLTSSSAFKVAFTIDGESAFEKITAGANLVQLYTGLIYKGPGIVKNIKTDMIKILKSENINNIEEAVGINS